jgi:WD40 repeat protein
VLATGDDRGVVCVWSIGSGDDEGVDFTGGAHRYSLRGHTASISTIVLHCHRYDERGGRILTASDDTTSRIWDTAWASTRPLMSST